jgi:hypothetical protein
VDHYGALRAQAGVEEANEMRAHVKGATGSEAEAEDAVARAPSPHEASVDGPGQSAKHEEMVSEGASHTPSPQTEGLRFALAGAVALVELVAVATCDEVDGGGGGGELAASSGAVEPAPTFAWYTITRDCSLNVAARGPPPTKRTTRPNEMLTKRHHGRRTETEARSMPSAKLEAKVSDIACMVNVNTTDATTGA